MGQTFIVAGSGFRGFCDALALSEIPGAEVHMLEAAPFWGGLSYSLEIDGFYVDKGVHMFDSIPSSLADIVNEIMDGQTKSIEFVSASAFNNTVTDGYSLPDLSSLDEGTKARIKNELLELAKKNHDNEQFDNLSELFLGHFGQTAGEIFQRIFKKVYSIDSKFIEPSGLSVTSLHRLKFLSDAEMLELKKDPWLDTVLAARRKNMGKIDDLVSVYPSNGQAMRGWCDRAVEWLKKKGVKISTGEKIEAVKDTGRGIEVTTSKGKIKADYLVWSNDNLTALADAVGIKTDIMSYHYGTPMIFVTMMTQADKIKDFTYVQNFDPDGMTYRTAAAGLYSNQIREDGTSFITSECPAVIGSEGWEDPDGTVPAVWEECKKLGVVADNAEMKAFKAIRIPATFKPAKIGYSEQLEKLLNELPKKSNRVILRDPTIFFRRSVYLDSLRLRQMVELGNAAA